MLKVAYQPSLATHTALASVSILTAGSIARIPIFPGRFHSSAKFTQIFPPKMACILLHTHGLTTGCSTLSVTPDTSPLPLPFFPFLTHFKHPAGYQVDRGVCAACHSLDRIAWHDLVGVSRTTDEVAHGQGSQVSGCPMMLVRCSHTQENSPTIYLHLTPTRRLPGFQRWCTATKFEPDCKGPPRRLRKPHPPPFPHRNLTFNLLAGLAPDNPTGSLGTAHTKSMGADIDLTIPKTKDRSSTVWFWSNCSVAMGVICP